GAQAAFFEARVERAARREESDAAEAADVAKTELLAIVERPDDVRMVLALAGRWAQGQLPGHAQVDEQTWAAQIDDDPLAAPRHAADALAARVIFHAAQGTTAQVMRPASDSGKTAARQGFAQIAHNGFDFR